MNTRIVDDNTSPNYGIRNSKYVKRQYPIQKTNMLDRHIAITTGRRQTTHEYQSTWNITQLNWTNVPTTWHSIRANCKSTQLNINKHDNQWRRCYVNIRDKINIIEKYNMNTFRSIDSNKCVTSKIDHNTSTQL